MTDWRVIDDFPAYEVSDGGDVRRADNQAVLVAAADHTGYRRVTFSVPGLKRYRYVHRLVALAFLGVPARGEIVCHRNGNPLDNRAGNLRYGTHKTNRMDAVAHGTAARSGPRFTRAVRQEIRIAARDLPTSALVERFGISPTYARHVRAQSRGA